MEEHTNDNNNSDIDNDLNNLDQKKEFDSKDAFMSEARLEESKMEKEDWYTDQESDRLENDLADDRDCIVEDESALGYEMS